MGRCLAGSEGSAGRSCCTLGSVALLGEGPLRVVCKRAGLPAVDSGCSGFVVAVVVVVAAVVVVVVVDRTLRRRRQVVEVVAGWPEASPAAVDQPATVVVAAGRTGSWGRTAGRRLRR